MEGRLRQILADVDFPAISTEALEALRLVPDDESSIHRLANIVLREYALTVKVLRTANSAHYRRTGGAVRSAAHAMLLLGAGTVRNLAGSLLLFEHYRKRSPGLKELMLLSLLTAHHARELAMLRRLPDPEEANLCGMFRNLGEVLVAAYFPDDYARVLARMREGRVSQGVAAFDVLGFPFEALGTAMARNWGMPEHVVAAIRSAGTQASEEALVITAFAHDLTTAVYRRECDPAGEDVAAVVARYARRLRLGGDEVAAVLQAALRETHAIFASARVTVDALTLRAQQGEALRSLGADDLAASWEEASEDGAFDPREAIASSDEGVASGMQRVPRERRGRDERRDPATLELLREALRGEVERLARPASGEELGRVMLTALEAVLRGGPFRRVVLCMLTPDHRQLRARHGLGAGVEGSLKYFTCDADARTSPIASAVSRRTHLALPLERDFSPSEWRFAQQVGASAFVAVPLVVAGTPIGCLYADRAGGDAPLDLRALAHVRAVCEVVQGGISARQSDAARPGQRSPEFKRDAVLRTLAGESLEAVAASLAMGAGELADWRREFLEGALARLAAG